MKKIGMFIAALCISFAAQAEGLLDRFNDPEKGPVTFVEKGNWAWGVSGNYYFFDVRGGTETDGFSLLSFLNLGEGQLQRWSASGSFSYLIADDLSLGGRLDYSGYLFDAALDMDLRAMTGEDDSTFQLASRHLQNNSWGLSLTLRKYLPFFGSRTFGVFVEGRFYGNVGLSQSYPLSDATNVKQNLSISTGLRLAAGAAIRLKDNSAITLSIPIVSAGYGWTQQTTPKGDSTNTAYINRFNVSRDIDLLAIQIGYVHYIGK